MSVNRYRINLSNKRTILRGISPRPVTLLATGATVNIPLNLEYQMVDQSEIIERDFVDVEIENVINPIFDYEKVRFIPILDNGTQVESVEYYVNFLTSTTFPTVSYYGDLGFVYDDVKFRKNRFSRSFLRLSFYDSDVTTDQRLISFMTLFPRITDDIIEPSGLPIPVQSIPIRFRVEDPVAIPKGISEGYHLYHFKDEVTNTVPKELYMRASFNNARDGKTTNMMTVSDALPINELVTKLHTKYVLTRDNDGYYYEIDPTYSDNVIITGNKIRVNLYEVQAT